MATENIDYKDFYPDIERYEYKTFKPIDKSDFNSVNKKTEFLIDFGDNFCSSKFEFYISGSLKKTDGTEYAVTDKNIKLIDNFVPFLFSKIEVRKHDKLLDEISYPGQLSTMRGTLTYSKSDMKKYTGFESHFGIGKFEAFGNLSHFGLGFFEDVNFPVYKGGFNLSFIRDFDDNAIFRWKTKKPDGTYDEASLPAIGKIFIEEFYIMVPLITYKTTSKIQLIDKIQKQQRILFNFKNWQCIRETNISGLNCSLDITNVYRNVYDPKFIIIGFQSNRLNNQLKDPSKFDSMNVKNFKVMLNGISYPDELQNLHISNKLYGIMYRSYMQYKKVNHKDSEMFYEIDEFIANRPIYVVDTTKIPQNISGAKSSILLNLDFQNEVSVNDHVVCFVLIMSIKHLIYDVLKNDLLEIK